MGHPATLPPGVRYPGAQLDDPSWTAPWVPPAGDHPLVLVATSSTFQHHVPDLHRIAGALGTLSVRGVITAGPALDLVGFDAPGNVQVVASAPHSDVLRHAAAVMTHGGHGPLSSPWPRASRCWSCPWAATKATTRPGSSATAPGSA